MLKESSGIPLDLDDPFVRIRDLILPHGQIADGVQFQLLLIAGKFRHLRQSIELFLTGIHHRFVYHFAQDLIQVRCRERFLRFLNFLALFPNQTLSSSGYTHP